MTEKGGAEVVVYNFIKCLDAAKFGCSLAHVAFRKGDYIEEFKHLGITPVDLKAGRLRDWHKTAAVLWRLISLIRREKIQVIVTNGAHNHIYAGIVRRILRMPVVTYVMDYYQPEWSKNHPIVKAALALGADYYLTCSYSCLKPLEVLIPKSVPRGVVYHGVDQDFVSMPADPVSVRRQLNFQEGQKLVTMIGRLQSWKGQDIFLQAAAGVIKKYPETRFALVGGTLFGLEPEYAERLKQMIISSGLSKCCSMVGHQTKVKDWMAASDIIIHASRTPEPGANVVMESMAVGKPVIASACGAPAEIIEEGVDGFLFEPGNPEHLASQIIKLLENPGLCLRLGDAAKRKAVSSFTAQKMASGLAAAITQVTGKGTVV